MDDTTAELDRKRSLRDQLKAKSRRRREGQASLSQPSARARPLRNDVLPALETIYVPLEDLRSPARKVRKLDPAHVRDVAAVMSELGFCVPVLIGKNNVVIDGEVRVEAAKLLGLGRAPCIRIDHLSDEEQRLLRLAVNRLGEKGEWNLDEAQDRVRRADLQRRSDRNLRLHPRRDRSDRPRRRRGRGRAGSARARGRCRRHRSRWGRF